MFFKLRQTNPDCLKKLQLAAGDVSRPGLGLSLSDRRELTERVSVIFHCAANVRFDQPLASAVLMNTKGTARLMKLADEIKNLEVIE